MSRPARSPISAIGFLQLAGILLFAGYAWLAGWWSLRVLYGLAAFACLWCGDRGVIGKVARNVLLAASIVLAFSLGERLGGDDPLAIRLVRFVETAIRFVVGPALLAVASIGIRWNGRSGWSLRFAVALTFAGHGSFAIGIFPPSPSWFEMVGNVLSMEGDAAEIFLLVVGVLDLVAALLILLPVRRAAMVGLVYCIVWGLATAAARPLAFGPDPWLAECLIRLPHGLVPLALLVAIINDGKPRREGAKTVSAENANTRPVGPVT